MKILQILPVAAALLFTGTACLSNHTASTQRQPETIVEVSNYHWSDMVVYGLAAEWQQRLGTVSSMTTVRMKLPPTITASGTGIQLRADPIGGNERFSTGVIQVSPGQRIEFTIQNHLAVSSYSVRNH